ncbi:TerB family tellurite resistance protein [Roseateles sp. UC29_93]|uniref:tellurite resistance TerB family protein n=1 Tax=Roseateles sp. UC29_93 TaxID=3350177 RepID=UPI00366D6029
MFKSLMDLFDTLAPDDAFGGSRGGAPSLPLAAAVLLVEVMRSDADFSGVERSAVGKALTVLFALSEDEADALTAQAERTARTASDLFAFTSPVDERWDMPAKLRLVELMWGVAYADGKLGDIERHTMWRIADLLHIPQGAYHHARIRAKAAAGLGEDD